MGVRGGRDRFIYVSSLTPLYPDSSWEVVVIVAFPGQLNESGRARKVFQGGVDHAVALEGLLVERAVEPRARLNFQLEARPVDDGLAGVRVVGCGVQG